MRSERRRASRRLAGLFDQTAGMKMPAITIRGTPSRATAIQGAAATDAVATLPPSVISSPRLTGHNCWPSQNPSDRNRASLVPPVRVGMCLAPVWRPGAEGQARDQ
jgi:hypothetical protein